MEHATPDKPKNDWGNMPPDKTKKEGTRHTWLQLGNITTDKPEKEETCQTKESQIWRELSFPRNPNLEECAKPEQTEFEGRVTQFTRANHL
jgi:hypothetical protein